MRNLFVTVKQYIPDLDLSVLKYRIASFSMTASNVLPRNKYTIELTSTKQLLPYW